MSYSPIYRRCLAAITPLAPALRRDVLAALEAYGQSGIDFWHAAGLEAGLARDELLARGASLYLLSSAVNLADDIQDGDAHYVPAAAAPLVVLTLQSAAFQALAATTVSRAGIVAATAAFAAAASGQHPALGPPWDPAGYRALAGAIGGQLVACYLRLLWDGTPGAAEALAAGAAFGTALLVDSDVTSQDPRLVGQPAAEVCALIAWGRAQAEAVPALTTSRTLCTAAAPVAARLAAAAPAARA